jgi:toxin FitB
MKYLLDTNVLSETRKPRGDEKVKRWISSASAADLYLSVLVVGEIRRGIERLKRQDHSQAEVYEAWLGTVLSDYADRILPVNAEIADEWGRMSVTDPVPVVDGLMAATAKVSGMTLVTRNTAEVERAGVRVLNPFGS